MARVRSEAGKRWPTLAQTGGSGARAATVTRIARLIERDMAVKSLAAIQSSRALRPPKAGAK